MGRLQRGGDAECLFFQEVAEKGHYAGHTVPSTTRQGIYAFAPSGAFLGSLNTRNPKAIEEMLRAALERWEALPREERRLSKVSAASPERWEDRYPEDGLVLLVHSRDLPRETAVRGWRAKAWNRDFAWFDEKEARDLLPAEIVPDAEEAWPANLAERLVRLHLVDNVRGQVSSFPEGSVQKARLVSRVLAVDGARAQVEISGETRAETRGRWPVGGFGDMDDPQEHVRGFETRVLGRAIFDLREERFTAFEMVAIGTRWGGTQFNGRADDLGPSPIGVLFTLAGGGPADRVAPAAIRQYGW